LGASLFESSSEGLPVEVLGLSHPVPRSKAAIKLRQAVVLKRWGRRLLRFMG